MSVPNAKRPSRPNRFGIGFFSITHILLLLATLVFLNYLSSRNHARVDLSRTEDYSLSSSTIGYLTGPDLADRKQPVKWIMAYRRATPFYDRVRSLAEEYTRKSEGKIQLEIIDPIRSPDTAARFAAEYNLTLVSDLILIDARPDAAAPVVTQTDAGSPTLNPHITLALADENFSYTVDAQGRRRPDAFRVEDLLTARLVEAIEGKPRTFLFLADKSRVDAGGDNSPWNNLETTLRYRNIRLKPANLAGLAAVPEDVEGIALVAPKYDFTEEEIAVLEAYWNRPRSALMILLEAGQCPPALRTFLRAKGVTPRRDRIITNAENRIVTAARGQFTPGVPFLKDMAGQSVVFEGASSSLEIRENSDDLALRKIDPVPLVTVSEGFWGEADFGKTAEDGNPGENFDTIRDTPPPLHLAAAITRGAANDDRFAAETSRLVVISNTDFLEPDRQRAENIDFLASAANWLVRRETLAGLSPRPIGTYKLPLFQAQVSFINRLNLIFIPLAFFLIGGIVFSSRRA